MDISSVPFKAYKSILILLVAVFVLNISCQSYRTMEDQYQHDADIVRLQHFDYYAKLLMEYYDANGKYPFQNEKDDAPIYFFIMTDIQEKKFKDTNPYTHYTINDRYFFEELSIGLGRNIDEKYDPQKVSSDNRPNMYIYMINRDEIYFAIHLYNSNAFTKQVRKYYNKMELSNTDDFENKFYTYKTLKDNSQYTELVTATAGKQGFFDELDAEYKNNSNAGQFEFSEMYFSHDIVSGETEVILYNIPTFSEGYAKKYTSLYNYRFKVDQFTFSNEWFNYERGFAIYQLELKAKSPLLQNENLTALLSKILQQEVKVEYMEPSEITKNATRPWSIMLPYRKTMYFGNSTTAIASYQNSNNALLVFDLGRSNKIEFVLGYK